MKVGIVIFAILATAYAGVPWIPESRNDQWWRDRHNSFVNNTLQNPDSIRVLFYGDSITEGWGGNGRDVYNQHYAPIGTANYGISADRTEHVRWRLINGEISSRLNPAVCVIKIGTNNIYDHSVNEIATGIIFNVIELRERLPNMKILLLGMLPRDNEAVTNKISEVNDIIKHLENGNTVRYLDMMDHFYRGNGQLVDEFFYDRLHLTTAGYRKWAEVMNPLFFEMLNSTLLYHY